MAARGNRQEILYPLGVTPTERSTTILLNAEGKEAKLLLYRAGEEAAAEELTFDGKEKTGSVWKMTLKGYDLSKYEYAFAVDGKPVTDPRARVITGRETWGDLSRAAKPVRARLMTEDFDWEDDVRPQIPYSDTVIYRLHVRGFTKHPSSKVGKKGTFAGVEEKIPYLKELGITAIELLPVTEFDEVMLQETASGIPNAASQPSGVINYWGYAPSFLFAVKAAYASRRGTRPENEFKRLVRSLHKAGIECLPEFYFTGSESPGLVLDALRYWVEEYHVDGFRLAGQAPVGLIAADPFLRGTKLLSPRWEEESGRHPGSGYVAPGNGKVTVMQKNLADCGMRFQEDMRRFLKGDEGMISALEYHSRHNPVGYGVVNSMANTDGFTMADMVSYDRKHNEANGEENRDGNDFNHSWNCGAEGPTRKKKILELRRQQLCNAFLLLFLSQGTPMILAGDEFGNSQDGNNNAYCQDNAIAWLNWRQIETNADLYAFVKNLIVFRKKHPIFHMEHEPRIMDYKSCGRPDVSYHGVNAWRPEYEHFRRQFGILYWGAYAKKPDGAEDDTFYVIYNMHWEPHTFGLPRLEKGQLWCRVFDTSLGTAGFWPEGTEPVLEDQVEIEVPPRSILVLCGKKGSGYYVYETPVGEITVCCKDAKVTGLHFGRFVPKEPGIKETRTELSDRVFAQLTEYFEGTRREFDLPLDPEGTEFQKKVWAALREIPYGETRTYKDNATAVGDEKATRAVGMANNKNPIAIIIPCHRVIGTNGTLTGYAGGLDVKKKLLELEKTAKTEENE